MRDYLTMKTGQIPKIDRVYESFKALARGRVASSNAELVADVYKHSKNWVKLAFERADEPELRAAIADLNQLKVDVAYPFLLEVLDDYDEGTISDASWSRSSGWSRATCSAGPSRHPDQHPQQDVRRLAREIDKANYLESLKAVLLLKESYARMPTDEEFRSAFLVKDVYNFRSRNYLLRKLENHDRKEPVDVDGYTIEHIMPQNPDLSPEWQDELGPDWKTVQERYCTRSAT